MMSGNDFRNSQAVKHRQKIVCDDDYVISSGRAFQMRGPATEKMAWWAVREADWYLQNAASVDRADLTQARGVPDTEAHFRGGLCMTAWQSCTWSSLVSAANEGWQARRWCGPRISCDRSAVPLNSVPIANSTWGKPGGQRVRRCHSPASLAPGLPPVTGMWLMALNGESVVVVEELLNIVTLFVGHVSAWLGQRQCKCPNHEQILLEWLQRLQSTKQWSVDDVGADLSHTRKPQPYQSSTGVC